MKLTPDLKSINNNDVQNLNKNEFEILHGLNL